MSAAKTIEEAVTLNYPRRWKNKDNGKEVRVMPWWETIKDGEIESVDELGKMISKVAGRVCKYGCLSQIGFLIETEHGVFFGVGPKAAEQFEDLGEWK